MTFRYQCRNHERIQRYGPLENTFLAGARLKGEMTGDKILLTIYMWFLQEPIQNVKEMLPVSAETAVYWYGFCRDVACAIAWHDYAPIGGEGDVVEVDESHLFKRKFNVGRLNRWNNIWILGGISRTTKKRFMVRVERRDAETLMPLLQQCVDEESYICSDYWRAYGECNLIFSGHGRVNHSENFVNPPKEEPPLWMPPGRFHEECLDLLWNGPPPAPGLQPFRIHTQNIESNWKSLKTMLKTSNNQEFVDQYLGEFMYRKNILSQELDSKAKFERLLRDIRRAYPGIGRKPMKNRREDILDCDCHECQP